ncbi:MAG: CehA/McbA family metallohydrolase [Anaerolineales bacterium]
MSYEYVGNLHCHTTYSDGWGTHNEIAAAAMRAGLEFVVVTDHNVLVKGADGYRYRDDKRILLLTGEEVHDQTRHPQKNHLLVYETGEELAHLAADPQKLIDGVNRNDGCCFLAHPVDPSAPLFGEDDLSWVSWEVEGYTGLEIWNFMTEFKSTLTSWPRAIYYAYRPEHIATGPFPETLARWDQMLAAGRRVFAIGGSDAHAMPMRKGPLKRTIFPYEFLFQAVNTHVLTSDPLSGDPDLDRRRLFLSIKRGRCFVGYDLPASTKGFRFTAASDSGQAEMGGTIRPQFGVSLQIHTPVRCRIRLLRDGELVREWEDRDQAVETTRRPGAYRVEAYLDFHGKERTWIISNPIFIQG